MKPAALFALALAGFAVAEEARRDEGQVIPSVRKSPWIGLSVGYLDDAVRAHVPELPAGIGFVVTEVAAGGPAEKAGVKAYDVFWKLGDQWIANEAQLLTLLRLHKEGDEVTLGLYRSGRALSLPVVLGVADDRVLGKIPALADGGRPATSPAVPMKVLNPAERSAGIEAPDGKAVLSIVNGEPEVKIISSDGALLYEGPANDLNGVSRVPEPWRPRVGALERALAHAMKTHSVPRAPRTRVLPPAADEAE